MKIFLLVALLIMGTVQAEEEINTILECKTSDDLDVTFGHFAERPELVTVFIEGEEFSEIIINEESIKKDSETKLKICSGNGCGFNWPYESYVYSRLTYDKLKREGVFRYVDRTRTKDNDTMGRKKEIKQVEFLSCNSNLRLFK